MTSEQAEFIKTNWYAMKNGDIAKAVGVSKWTIICHARRMGLKAKPYVSKLTPETKTFLQANQDKTIDELAQALNVAPSTIRRWIKDLNISRPRKERATPNYRGSICFTCKRSGRSECSWDKKLEPTPGWVAIKTKTEHNGGSYHVVACPLFLQDRV